MAVCDAELPLSKNHEILRHNSGYPIEHGNPIDMNLNPKKAPGIDEFFLCP